LRILLEMQQRALDDEEFCIMSSKSYAMRIRSLVPGEFNLLCSRSDNLLLGPNVDLSPEAIVKMAANEDMLRTGLGSHTLWGGTSGISRIIKANGCMDSIKALSLPSLE
jgi:hypothetical protein